MLEVVAVAHTVCKSAPAWYPKEIAFFTEPVAALDYIEWVRNWGGEAHVLPGGHAREIIQVSFQEDIQ